MHECKIFFSFQIEVCETCEVCETVKFQINEDYFVRFDLNGICGLVSEGK